MFRKRAHDLQSASLVGDAHSWTVHEVIQQLFVLLPRHIRDHENGPRWKVLDGFEVLRASSAHACSIAEIMEGRARIDPPRGSQWRGSWPVDACKKCR